MGYKKIGFFVVIVIFVFTANNLSHAILTTMQKQELIVKAQKDLEAAKEENQELRKNIAQVNKPDFVESEARDKLLLTKPDEEIIVIPSNTVKTPTIKAPPPPDTRPNYQKWWETFFKE